MSEQDQASYKAGLEAYNAGEWQSAYVQLIGPAENGDSQAQGMIASM
jgi:hypothetical protein